MKRLAPYLVGLVVLGVLVAAGLLWLQGRDSAREAQWQADRDRLVADAAAAMARADSATAAADSAEARSAAAIAMADSLRARRPALRVHIDTVEVPAEALPFTEPRDELIDDLSAENALLRVAVAEEQLAVGQLRVANTDLRAAVDSLTALVNRAPVGRAKLFGLPLPELTVGYSAGVDRRDRTFFDGPAVSVGWRIGI